MGVDVHVDAQIEWTRDLGEGRLLVMERTSAGYRATLIGFLGAGSTPGAALDDLLRRLRDYCATSTDLARSLAPGGHLHEQLRQLEQIVDSLPGTS